MKRTFAILLLAATAACTIQRGDDGTKTAEIHNPFRTGKWEIVDKPAPGTCVISSSYNGLNVVFTKKSKKAPMVGKVVSARRMNPGNYMHLNVAGHYYQTAEKSFAPKYSAAIIEDFKTGETAYVSWKNVGNGEDRHIIGTEIDNSAFTQRYEECRKALK